ncbi:MAG: ABC transporter ATP-binding protein [candidate division Zixibacteria bacterium]|nr:ABC transporter ATP-binding protein [candidate division Zixibacteria bacterium]
MAFVWVADRLYIATMYRLTATDLTKRFGSRKVFSGVSFEVTTGQALAIVGPNGSGKSTLVMTLLGEVRPTRGSAVFADDAGILTETAIQRTTSLVSPYLNLYDSLSGEENLVFFSQVEGAHTTGKQINALLERVGLAGRGSDLVHTYSSGMKQRLKYALALMNEPAFLFLDEPTSNLDDDGKRIVYDIIEEYTSRAIVVIATNETEDQRFASQFCRLDG